MSAAEKNEVLLFSEQKITAYDPFRAQLAELKSVNEKAVFDYQDPKGNKEARSHIYKLRQTKSAVDKVRKDQKQASLDYGRRVDAQAKEIITKIEDMIEVHQKPLDEIEQREKDRIAAHQERMHELQTYMDQCHLSMSSNMINNYIHELEELEPDESWEEFTAPGLKLYKQAREFLIKAHEDAAKREAEQAELERLRADQVERERKEREERIAKESAERAKYEAEAKAKADAEAAEKRAQEEMEAAARREAEAKAAQERAEQARIAAEAKAKQDAIDAERRQQEAVKAAEERARREADEVKRKEEEDAKAREADKKHKAAINNAALNALVKIGAGKDLAKSIVESIAKGEIPNVKISY